jgi:PAS domain S-box-containing protein
MTRAVEVADHRAWYPLVLIFAILALGIFGGGIFSYRNYERRFRTGIEQQLSAIAELKVNDLALWRKERLGDASVLFKNASFSGLVRRFLDRPDDAEAQAQLRAWLEKFQAANRYECIFLLDAQGVERMSTAGTAGPVAAVVSRRAGEVLRSREVGFQDFYRNEQDQRIYLATLAPILDGPDFGQGLGVLVLNIDPAIHLYPVISRWPTPSRTAETLLVRRDGHDALFLNELKFRTNAALKLRIPLERTNAPAVKAALGQQGIVEGIDYRSEPVVAALRAIPDSPWSMVARMDTAEVYAPLRERLWLTVLLMGALLLGAGASVGLLWRQQHVQFYRERAAASERLRESLQRFQLANRATFDAIWDWNLQTDAFWWNENFQTLFGYRAEEVEPDSESWKKRIHPEDLDRVKTGIQAAIDSGQDHWSDQYRFRRKDGTYAEVEDRSYIAREASGHPVRMIGAMQDTTERRQAEEKVRKSEERRRLALEAANAGTWSWDVASNVSTWDERYQAQYGFEPGEPASLEAWMTRVHPEDRQRLQARIRALLEPGPDAAWEQEFRALHPVKGERWMIGLGRVQRDPSGRALRFVGINLDITERRQAESRLQEYERVIEGLQEMIAVVDRNYRYLIANRAFLGHRGLGRSQVVGHTVAEVLDKEFFEQVVKEKLDKCFEGATLQYEVSYTYPNLGERTLFVSYFPIKGPAGVDRAACVLEDITEGKRAEAGLQRLAAIVESSNDGIISKDLDGIILTWNPGAEHIFGYRPEEVIGQNIDLLVPENLHAEEAAILEKVREGERIQHYEALRLKKDGTPLVASLTISPVKDAAGTIVGASKIVRDITERKQVQQRLQELNLVRQAAGAINALMMRERDPKRLLAEACKILVETRGYRFVWIGQVEPGSKRVVPAAHAGKEAGYLDAVTITWDETPTGQGPTGTAIRTGQPMACQDTATDPRFAPWKEEAMARGFASLAAMPMMHGSRVLGAVVVYAGHTEVFNAEELDLLKELAGDLAFALQSIEHEQEQKRAEAALRESSQFNQQIITSAQEGIIVYGRDLRYQVWNPFMEQMTGMSEDQVQGKHPDELFPFLREAGVLASIEKVLAGEPISSIEVHVEGQPTGISGWTFQTNGPLRNAAREIIGVIGIIRDITEPKRAELRIQAFSQLGQRLSTARSAAEAARAIYACADQFWKWDCGVLDLQVPESGQVETALAYDLVDGQRREVLPADPVGPPSAMNRRVMAQGAELILRKLDEPPATDTIRFGAASRLSASLMCVPVRVENRAVGVLSIQSYTPDAYTQEDLRMLQALADHCGGALDRLWMEALLRSSEIRYRRLFEEAKDGVLILDAKTGMVVDVNPFLVQLLGFSREAFLGKKIWELGFFKDIVANHDRFKELQEAEYIRYDDKPLETADGRRIDVEFVSNVYEVNHHAVIQCNIRDITARKRSEWLGLIYRDQLRALSARIETMREAERTRISREIHDELGQMLTGIKMDLRWVEHRLDEFGEDRRVNPILDKLVVTAELADATIKVVQRIAAELRPGILDKLGLPTALQYEAARFEERTGIACRLVVPGDALPLRPEVATAFFRIFEETLTNVTRHAKATAVEVELQPVADDWRLEIRDNGQGMAGVDLQNPKSLGLLGMQERASLLGGGVSFAPRPGGGTVVTVRIPNSQTQRGGV